MEIIKVLEAGSLQSGWEAINEYLYLESEEVAARGGGAYGPEWVSYNNYVVMRRAWVDPELDLGKMLGYSIKKWSSLVNNYVDFRYLDMIRAEIRLRQQKRARSYNLSFHFSNKHGSGKDCLISLNFTKRIGIEEPIVVFNVRTSEVTKRLIFDFILVQRIIEYVYGHNDAQVHFFAPSFYITTESFVMYNNHKDIKKLLENYLKNHSETADAHKFHERVFEKYDEYINHPDPKSIRYKVHRRSALQIRKDKNGEPESGVKSMKVKTLQLRPRVEHFPENIISRTQQRKYRKDANK